MPRRAVLLINLGSPASTSVADVRTYLEEFLGDSRVIDRPRWSVARRFLVNRIIIPKRAANSAHAYSTIWTPEGSPLIVISQRVRDLLAAQLGDTPVYLAMRYGQPSIASVMAQIAVDGIDELLVFPQYPHYAMSSWETVAVLVCEQAAKLAPRLRLHAVKPFYADDDYIDALASVSRPYLEQPHDHVLFSYHGLPVRHVGIASLRGVNVTFAEHPQAQWTPAHGLAYTDHITQTTVKLVARAGIKSHSIAYQSRLGNEPWLSPYTDTELPRLAREGFKQMLIISPAFTVDCLETLEELQARAREDFMLGGGATFAQIPCLNDHPAFIDFLAKRVRHWLTSSR